MKKKNNKKAKVNKKQLLLDAVNHMSQQEVTDCDVSVQQLIHDCQKALKDPNLMSKWNNSDENKEWQKVLIWAEKVGNLQHDSEYTRFGVEACERGFHCEIEDGLIFASNSNRDNAPILNICEGDFEESDWETGVEVINYLKSNLQLYKKDKKGNLIKVDISKVK